MQLLSEIKFTKVVYRGFLGRNGRFNQSGLRIWIKPSGAEIFPITSKNEEGSCHLTIRFNKIDDVIKQLKEAEKIGLDFMLKEISGSQD